LCLLMQLSLCKFILKFQEHHVVAAKFIGL